MGKPLVYRHGEEGTPHPAFRCTEVAVHSRAGTEARPYVIEN
jgi:hypothetical protein